MLLLVYWWWWWWLYVVSNAIVWCDGVKWWYDDIAMQLVFVETVRSPLQASVECKTLKRTDQVHVARASVFLYKIFFWECVSIVFAYKSVTHIFSSRKRVCKSDKNSIPKFINPFVWGIIRIKIEYKKISVAEKAAISALFVPWNLYLFSTL